MIELTEGQELSLSTDGGAPLTRLRMAVGWEHTHTAGFAGSGSAPVDLDASAVQFAGGALFDLAFFNHLSTRDGSVVHLGDNTTGKGEGDDETIDFHLANIESTITEIYLVVSAFKESNKMLDDALGTSGFGGAENVQFRFYDMEADKVNPLFKVRPSLMRSENACVLIKLTRNESAPGAWDLVKLDHWAKVTHGDRTALLRSALNAR